MNRKILMFSILMAATPGLAADSSVYKWTDDNGVTHFGDRQPTGKTAEQVNVRSGTSRNSGSERASPQERLNQFEEQQQASAERKKETAVEEANRKQREANCKTAKENLKVISSNARIRVEENGEQRYLSPEEIDEQRKKFEAFAEENCGPA
ncbi:DUF4124 domain-containing protein [Marinobacter litoralis]|uniref:DUF4124 domain-containing protein n=1 Tax=Marinobacter litoralis TaxID=187981 RepID=UPI0018EB0AC2|nr:DUF4124 domain-containing protein [Marinobacter litoralis]MBJ6138643.1 DUF4124 domain-containing protein [Marinobacter litoralis]